MSKIPQSSTVEFYSNIYISQGDTIPFKSRAQLEAYFNQHKEYDTKLKSKKFSYIRRTGQIKVQLTTKEVEKCNYFMFHNPAFEDIKFYCRIMDCDYVNNNTTLVKYVIDTWLTYFDKVQYTVGTVEREHLSEDGYQKSLINPYDPTIYEFQTNEDLPVAMDMEPIYFIDSSGNNWDMAIFPGNARVAKEDSCVVIMVADFDTSQLGDINTFYNYFDEIVDSTGNILTPSKTDAAPTITGQKVINIGRAYGLYKCNVGSPYDPGSIAAWIDHESAVSKAVKWLNKQGLTGQILSIIQMNEKSWKIYLNPDTDDSTIIVPPRNYDVKNKKLLLFPYQYLRVYNYEGDVKEYKYEKFIDVAAQPEAANRYCKFKYLTLFDNVPVVSLVPIDYKIEGPNSIERIDCSQYPQVGYSTNTFDTFMASEMSKALIQHTGTIGENISEAFSNLGTLKYHEGPYSTQGLEGLSEMAGDAGTAFGKAASYIAQNPQTMSMIGSMFSLDFGGAVDKAVNLPTWDYKASAKEWRAGDNTMAASGLAGAKPAFVSYDYHPGSSNGTLGYYLPNNTYTPGSYLFVRAYIRKQVLDIYDNYFTLYGYKSGRIGIPRILNYVLGKTEGLPHFEEYGEVKVTYAKTSGLHVEYVRTEVASTIEDMFNSGIRFVIPPDMPEV